MSPTKWMERKPTKLHLFQGDMFMITLNWKPNRSSHIPLHKQVEDYLKAKIVRGEWTVGTRIPSQRVLAEALGVNRSTIVTAIEELASLGFLEGNSGAGTKVMNTTWSMLASVAPPDWTSYVRSGQHQPNLPTIQEIHDAEADPNVIRIGTGELSPELLPYEKTKDIFKRLSSKNVPLGYEEAKGSLVLREQIAEQVGKMGIHASPSSILIVSGALQALQLISIGLLHRGSSILLERPSYLYSLNVFQSAGMKLHGVPIDDQGIQTSFISHYKRQYEGTLLYTIPSFQNPTGILMSDSRRKELLTICEKESLPLIEDDVYRDLWLDEAPPKPIKAYDKNGMVLYLGSMSKTISPGLRIGWVIGPEPVIDRLSDVKMQTDYGASSLSQVAATEWLSSGLYEEHIQDVRNQLRIRRDFVLELLQKHFHDIAEWNVPKGGFYIWTKLMPHLSYHELFRKALKAGILLNPGHLYDRESSQYLRISYSYASMSDLEKGLRKLALIIRELITERSNEK